MPSPSPALVTTPLYSFRVRAVNGVGPGPASNPASATPTGQTARKLSWLARFGRTVADHALDTIEERVTPSPLTTTGTAPGNPAANLGAVRSRGVPGCGTRLAQAVRTRRSRRPRARRTACPSRFRIFRRGNSCSGTHSAFRCSTRTRLPAGSGRCGAARRPGISPAPPPACRWMAM